MCPALCTCVPKIQLVSCQRKEFKTVPGGILPIKTKILYLQYNHIEVLTNTSLSRIIEITELDLSYNSLTTIDNNAFRNHRNLTILQLHHNQLRDLPQGVFDHLVHLRVLDLSFNKLGILPTELLGNTFQLQNLDLSNNKIKELPGSLLDNITQVKVLNFSSNIFGDFYKWSFRRSHQLTHLNLSNVYISMITPDMFYDIKNLRVLDLSQNQIYILTMSAFQGLFSLERLYLNGNPFHCDCQLNGFFSWLRNASHLLIDSGINNSTSTRSPTCVTPEKMKGSSLLDIMTQNLTCAAPKKDIRKKYKNKMATLSYQSTENKYKSKLKPLPYNPWMGVGTAGTLSGMLVLFLLCMACDKAKRFYYKKRWQRRTVKNRTFHTYLVNSKEASLDEADALNSDVPASKKLFITDSVPVYFDKATPEIKTNDVNNTPVLTIQDTAV